MPRLLRTLDQLARSLGIEETDRMRLNSISLTAFADGQTHVTASFMMLAAIDHDAYDFEREYRLVPRDPDLASPT